MNSSRLALFTCLAFAMASSLLAADKPKVIVLGFDGADADLAEKFMDEGICPNMDRLRNGGTFAPLMPANPAQSPVSWASLNTGQNPGKTNIFGFLRRGLQSSSFEPEYDQAGNLVNKPDLDKALSTIPELGWGKSTTIPAEGVLEGGSSGGGGLKAPMAGLVVMVLAFFALSHFLHGRLKQASVIPLAGALSLVIGAGAAFGAWHILDDGMPPTFGGSGDLPEDLTIPTDVLYLAAENFWDTIGKEGVKSHVLQAAITFPVEANENVRILSGLGVMDIGGNPGSWYVYTTSPWEFEHPTGSGGKVMKFKVKKKTGDFKFELIGPRNFIRTKMWNDELASLQEKVGGLGEKPTGEAADEKKALEKQIRTLKRQLKDESRVTVEVTGNVDYDKKTMTLVVDGQSQSLNEGQWSAYYEPVFDLGSGYSATGTVRFLLETCDSEEVRLFVPPVCVNPKEPLPYHKMASPPAYAQNLAKAAGPFDTVGWSCQTHALKDNELGEQGFLDDIEHTLEWRRKILDSELSANEFDCYFQVFGTVDRVCHMMYRHYEPTHPMYQEKLATEKVRMFGKEVEKREAVREIYRQMDDVIGSVMKRIDDGEFGDDVTLMVVADHGFNSFSYQVEMNKWLFDNQFLGIKGVEWGEDPFASPGFNPQMLELYVDWSKTKAYSMGLGKLYLNLEGRERHFDHETGEVTEGIVAAADYDAVCDEIISKLKTWEWTDDKGNVVRPVLNGYKTREIYSGDFRDARRGPGGVVEHAGCSDIIMGFNEGFRIAWATGTGGMSKEAVSANNLNWSGDHASTDPSLVTGVFFSNRSLPGALDIHLMDVAPTVMSIFGVDIPEAVDGKALALKP